MEQRGFSESEKDRADAGNVRFLIVGMGRSGTTLVQRLVSEVDGVWVPPETHFWRYAADLADKFPPPLDHEASEAAMAWFLSLQSSAELHTDAESVAAHLHDGVYLWDLFAALVASLSPAGTKFLGEKTPDHAFWAPQLLAAIPRLRLIGVVRDPREVYRSQQSVPWGIGDPWESADKWVAHVRVLEDVERLFPGRVMTARYEDLVAEPERARVEALSLVGVSEMGASSAGEIGPLFNPGEWWKERSLQPIARLADTWQADIDPNAVSVIEWCAFREMARWGYPSSALDRALPPSVPSPSVIAARKTRLAAESPLPVTEGEMAAWLASGDRAAAHWKRVAESERERANEKLEQMRGRRWWRLGEALWSWRSAPWRLGSLARDVWRALFRPAPAAAGPGMAPVGMAASDAEIEKHARAAFLDGDADGCLSLLDQLSEEKNGLPRTLELRADCHELLGELTVALESTRRALAENESKRLRLKETLLSGELRATEPGWLPAVALVNDFVPAAPQGRDRAVLMMKTRLRVEDEPVLVVSMDSTTGDGGEAPAPPTAKGAAGHEVELVSPYRVEETPLDQVLTDRAWLLSHWCREPSPGVVHVISSSEGTGLAVVGIAFARSLSAPIVYEVEEGWLQQIDVVAPARDERSRRRRAQEIWCLSAADLIVVSSSSMRDRVLSLGVATERVTQVDHATSRADLYHQLVAGKRG